MQRASAEGGHASMFNDHFILELSSKCMLLGHDKRVE